MNKFFTMGDFVTRNVEWGKADGIADQLSVNTAYLVIGIKKNGFLRLLDFTVGVDPQYLRMALAREIVETKRTYGFPDQR
jgi:hypothetical protein